MRFDFKRALALGLMIGVVVVATPSKAQNFGAVAWIPLTQSGVPIGDPATDANSERNIVGDVTNPAAYVGSDADYLYFRVRLDEDPRSQDGTTLKPFGWSCAVETQGTADTYEYLAAVNGIENSGPDANPDQVEWRHNAVSATGTNNVGGAGGVAWLTGRALGEWLAFDAVRKIELGSFHSPVAVWVATSPILCALLAVFTLLVELGAPVALASPRLARAWSAAAWCFHAGILLTMAIGFFYPLSGVAFASLLDVERHPRIARLARFLGGGALAIRGDE
jgi:hypothetical protein